MTFVFFVAGLVLLVVGAELLVRGASRLAVLLGISPLVIGLTVVAYGTSAPEMAVSVAAAINGQADIAVGNVVGSNIFNILFILGLCSLILPLKVSRQLIRFDVPVMIATSTLMYLFASDRVLNFAESALLFCLGLGYTVYVIRQSRKSHKAAQAELEKEFEIPKQRTSVGYTVLQIVFIIIGLLLLVQGSRWLVEGAISMARSFGVSELIISLTIVAAGTSLPEVAASVMAAIRGERDIAIGNCVGSNIFNVLSVLAVTGMVSPDGIAVSTNALNFDIPVMLGVAVLCLPIFYTHRIIARWEGGLFLACYFIYTSILVVQASGEVFPPLFLSLLQFAVFPSVVLMLLWQSLAWFRRGEKGFAE